MDYDRIIIEMLSRIYVLEDKLIAIEQRLPENPATRVEKGSVKNTSSKKYRRLSDYLYACGEDKVRLTIRDIENILGFKPPPSAYLHRAFWANTKTHSIALSWMSVGYETVEVSIEDRYVVFERKRDYSGVLTVGRKKAEEFLTKHGLTKISNLTNVELKK